MFRIPILTDLTLFKYRNGSWFLKWTLFAEQPNRSPPNANTRLCCIHHKFLYHTLTDDHFFKHFNFLSWKTFHCKEGVETTFKVFLVSKTFKGQNNLVTQWQKYIDVQGSYFDRFKHCLNTGREFILKADIICWTI